MDFEETYQKAKAKYENGNKNPMRVDDGKYVIWNGRKLYHIYRNDKNPVGYWGRWQVGLGKALHYSDTLSDCVKWVYHQPAYPPIHPHETFHFLYHTWDIAKAWKDIITTRHVLIVVPLDIIDTWYEQFNLDDNNPENNKIHFMSIYLEHETALTVNLDIPIIIGFIPDDGFPLVIDGWHRVYRAHHDRVPLKAYLLTAEENEAIYMSGL